MKTSKDFIIDELNEKNRVLQNKLNILLTNNIDLKEKIKNLSDYIVYDKKTAKVKCDCCCKEFEIPIKQLAKNVWQCPECNNINFY